MAGYTRQAAANIVTGGVIDAADFNAEYNAIEAAFNASTGHTHDGTTGNGPPIENLGPAADLVVTSSVVRPKVDNTYDLGTSAIEWKDGFFDGTLRTDVLTVDETSTLTGNVTASADVSIGGNLTVTGDATISGNLTFGDADTDSINLSAEIDSNIIPNTTGTYNLGSATKEWNDLFIDGTANIDSLVADTADINGGNIDGTVIGANSSAAITGTVITASTNFAGNITGDVTGDVKATNGTTVFNSGTDGTDATYTGDVTGDLTGNASTATALATARTIAGQSFDGTANISIAPTDLTGVTSTAAEINALDGFTGVVADLNYAKDLRATGVTTAEFDKLDGLSATTAELNYVSGVTSAIQTQINSKQATITGAATTIDTENLTASRALVSDSSGKVAASSTITTTELGYLNGVTSNIQTQLDAKGSGSMSNFRLQDGDGNGVVIDNAEYIKFVEGTGIDIDWTDTTTGSSTVPYDMTFSLLPDQRFAAATDVYVGNSHEHIHFNDGSARIEFMLGNVERMRLSGAGDLDVDGNITAYSTTISDQRLKHDIQKIDGALDKLSQLSGYTFSYNKDGKKSAGVIAQEVEKVLPSAVENKSLVFHGEEDIEYKTVQYDQLHGLLIEAIKELKAEIEELKNGSTK